MGTFVQACALLTRGVPGYSCDDSAGRDAGGGFSEAAARHAYASFLRRMGTTSLGTNGFLRAGPGILDQLIFDLLHDAENFPAAARF